jgi:superfamily I DNA and RNA helicase
MPQGSRQAKPLDVHAFLSERVEVVPDIEAVSRHARGETRRLAGGLTTWAQRLTMSPFRLRVSGTAGSGKTQLALTEMQLAAQRGERALYLCFNRSLADAMRRIAPAQSQVLTFHEMGAQVIRVSEGAVNFEAQGEWDRIAAASISEASALRETVDVLVIDEGQDLEGHWIEALVGMVKPSGRAVLLEDKDQQLYGRTPANLPGWVALNSPVNYRSPQVIVTLIEQLGLVEGPLLAGGPIHGWDPEMRVYKSNEDLVKQTEMAVRQMIEAGHESADIAVLSWRGIKNSVLMGLESLAGLRVARATGGFDEYGQAIYSEGSLRVETVFRFKGQSADCVVISEVDFVEWAPEIRRRLFVAMTRARIRVALVVSTEAERQILSNLGSN